MRTSFIDWPWSQDCRTNGPELTGCAEKLLAFSSSVVPADASNAFFGRIAVLKTVSAARIAGSVFLSLRMTVLSPSVVTSWIEATRKPQMPFFGSAARFSDHCTSAGVIGDPSENLMPSRSVSVTLRPSSDDLPFGREAGLHALAVVGRQDQRVVEVGQDPDVDIGVVEHRIEEQAVCVAAVFEDAAAFDRECSEADPTRSAALNAALTRCFMAASLQSSTTAAVLVALARFRVATDPVNASCAHKSRFVQGVA